MNWSDDEGTKVTPVICPFTAITMVTRQIRQLQIDNYITKKSSNQGNHCDLSIYSGHHGNQINNEIIEGPQLEENLIQENNGLSDPSASLSILVK